MRIYKFILFFLLVFPFHGFAQENQVINGTISWNEYSLSSLSKTEFQPNDYLYYTRVKIPYDTKSIETTWKSTCYTSANNKEIKQLNSINLSTEIAIKTEILTEQKKPFLGISFLPFRKNPESGIIEKLTSFEINLSYSKNTLKSAQFRNYANQSLLASGNWYKIKIDTGGVFKLTYEQLEQIGLSNPANVALYGFGGEQLPYMNNIENYDDLVELPIYMNKGTDGTFGPGDYILFYSTGPITWSYDSSREIFMQHIHDFSYFTYLFISSDVSSNSRITNAEPINEIATTTSNSYDSYACHEIEKYNLIESGRTWYVEKFHQGGKITFSFNFPNIITSEPVKMLTDVVGRKESSAPDCYFNIYYNNSLLSNLTFTSSYTTYVYGQSINKQLMFNAASDQIKVDYIFGGGNTSSEGYLNYLCLNARENLVYSNHQLAFRDTKSVQSNQITEFSIHNNGNDLFIWDVSTPVSPHQIVASSDKTITKFKANTTQLKEFIAFTPNDAFTPIIAADDLGLVENQNLHGISAQDMIIVSHPDFLDYAEKIAEIHRQMDGLQVYVTTPQEIYNEFSSGTPDVSAIRNFMRMLYDNASSSEELPKYLLLFGDGSYDNRSTGNGNSNLIPTYQSTNSLAETASYVSDDFFGLLDYNEGEYLGALDIGIGRFPVQTKEEAQLMIDKINQYLTGESSSIDWKSTICFIGDDGDSGIHMNQPESISKTINAEHPEYNVKKIYLDAYEQVSTPAGQRFPDVTVAINQQVAQGALIIDYVGHGNPRILTHEEVLSSSDVRSWTNFDRLSVFVTASCEVGRFDDYNRTSLGEWFVLNPNGGGIAALTTTRVVYSGGNHTLNTNFFNAVFNTDSRLGDIIRIAKVNTSTDQTNKRNFTLLGDPALKLSIPENKANIFEINGNSLPPIQTNNITSNQFVITGLDTLHALSQAKVSGYIQDSSGQVVVQNGTLYISIFDKTDTLHTLGQDNASISFTLQNKLLYKGKASITNGYFIFDFIVPKDINYKFGLGKISLLAELDSAEAIGYSDAFFIGGSSKTAETDLLGPEISLYMNDTLFKNGGTTNENPVLLAVLKDNYGINTTGNGFGHNIVATLDGNQDNIIILNSFYEGEIDKFNQGELRYPLSNLAPGYHKISFKAWDIYNNSTESNIEFYVYDAQNPVIENLQNAPNPFYDYTVFTFEHNQANTAIDIIIDIYDLMGNKVAQLKQNNIQGGYKTAPIPWNGTCLNGAKLSRGVYIYKATLLTADGQKTSKSSKLMIFE